VWRWDQAEPFGANPANDDPDGNLVAFDLPLRLPGQRYDQESGLHYNYFRDYDPSIGRYGESDPIGLKGGMNTYAYVLNQPLVDFDPFGQVNWRGTFGGVSYGKGVGGGLFTFDLTSDCTCGKRLRIQGTVLTGMAGVAFKIPLSVSGAEFYDYHACPSDTVADGFASFAMASAVVGPFGGSCSNQIVLGGLRSRSGCTSDVVGLDISAGIYLGVSRVTHAEEECCTQ